MTWTTAIAAYAAVVSTGSLVVALLAWRSGGPQLQARAGLVRAENGNGWLSITVNNRGRADITIESMQLWVGKLSPRMVESFKVERGPELPHRLVSHSSIDWVLPPDVFDGVLGRRIRWHDPARVEFSTPLGSFKVRVQRQPEEVPFLRWFLQKPESEGPGEKGSPAP
jgi:hypothetical protein